MAGRLIRRFWPILLFVLLLISVGLFFLIRSLLPGPEEAVEGYIRSSLQYDVDSMLFYASDYQKKALAGNADVPEETLRANLKSFYQSGGVTPVTEDIRFSDPTVAEIDPESERYREYLTEYGYKADPEKVGAMRLVKTSCSVGGKHFADYRVVAVRCGLRWYYGMVVFD